MNAKDKRKAIKMYEADVSMRQIQKKLGAVTVKDIRNWCIEEAQKPKCSRPNCTRRAIGVFENIEYCKHCLAKQKKKALKRAKQRNQRECRSFRDIPGFRESPKCFN